MVKRLKRRRGTTAQVRSLYNKLVHRMRADGDYGAMFGCFADLCASRALGEPNNNPLWRDLWAALGQEGFAGQVFDVEPVVFTFESQEPPLVHGTVQFGSSPGAFFFLPDLGRGLATLVIDGKRHFRPFSLNGSVQQSSGCGCC